MTRRSAVRFLLVALLAFGLGAVMPRRQRDQRAANWRMMVQIADETGIPSANGIYFYLFPDTERRWFMICPRNALLTVCFTDAKELEVMYDDLAGNRVTWREPMSAFRPYTEYLGFPTRVEVAGKAVGDGTCTVFYYDSL